MEGVVEKKLESAEKLWRIYIGTRSCLLGEALAKWLGKLPHLQVAGQGPLTPEAVEVLERSKAEALLLHSSGDLTADLSIVEAVQEFCADFPVMLLGMSEDPGDFLKCVRAGVSGYVIRTASSKQVLQAIEVVRAGGASCPGHLCRSLFNYFRKNATICPLL